MFCCVKLISKVRIIREDFNVEEDEKQPLPPTTRNSFWLSASSNNFTFTLIISWILPEKKLLICVLLTCFEIFVNLTWIWMTNHRFVENRAGFRGNGDTTIIWQVFFQNVLLFCITEKQQKLKCEVILIWNFSNKNLSN